MERGILINTLKLNIEQFFMSVHVCEDTCSNVLISSFGNFELFVVSVSPNVLMDRGNPLFKN